MVEKIFDSVIDKIIEDEKPIAILLVGSAVKTSQKELEKLRDIDIFVIIEKDSFYREVINKKSVDFDISYLPIELMKKAISRRTSSLINVLYNSKVIFKSSTAIDNYLNEIKNIYLEGPKHLYESEIKYIRFRLYQMYETILNKKDDELNAAFLINSFIKELIYSYFKLNRIWTPSDKKIIKAINEIDNILYSLIVRCYNSHNIDYKIKIVSDMLDYVLTPFGGTLKEWEKSEYPFDFT